MCDALRALGFLAGAETPVLIADIARGTGLRRPSLAKLVSTLCRKGLVVTRRGIGGGASLSRRPESITLYDVCLALDEPVIRDRCLLGARHDGVEDGACPARGLERRQRDEVLAFLRHTTVHQITALAHGETHEPAES